ncbi:N-formylglutamate amidohydrolase [Luteimonas viscosa]|uniref:N-formylglutamate amidohydrolase n=1 Tax=Luteimonas viscosa TaxID=1132694 RepID=A0A5D4XK25_9GAMM|nr:N-formylglutamate amidohydrolase [Luteimonas viscosa]TYT24879.1 N-formylglutamate amidohydrolase [Luteimonas viscosa]
MIGRATHDRPTAFFTPQDLFAPTESARAWDVSVADGPVVATAIHDGHAIRPSLRPLMALSPQQRLREEDPLTGLLTTVGDVRIRVPTSRFEVDLNRPRDGAVYARPEHCWGLEAWHAPLPAAEIERSLAMWDRFYAMVTELLDRMLERWDAVLLIDLHSYNHRRDGADAPPQPQADNPDIELGLTTADPGRWGAVAERFADALRAVPLHGRAPDVRANVRFPTGGHFPEWVYARWGARVCTISPEYKKIFMDEWSGHADIAALNALREGLHKAVEAVRPMFGRAR